MAKIKSLIKMLRDVVVKAKVFLAGFLEILIILKDLDSKEFDKKENFCYSLKLKTDKQYYFFIGCAVCVWSFSLVVLTWDYVIIKKTKFFMKRFGAAETYKIMLYITNNQDMITFSKISMISLSLGFMLILHLYQIMSFVIIINKMIPLIQGCVDKKERVYFFLILLHYSISIFTVNILVFLSFSWTAYFNGFY
jgi:hypothetical protein